MMLAILLKTTETYDLNLSRESLAQDASNDNINPAPYKQQSPDYYCYAKFLVGNVCITITIMLTS